MNMVQYINNILILENPIDRLKTNHNMELLKTSYKPASEMASFYITKENMEPCQAVQLSLNSVFLNERINIHSLNNITVRLSNAHRLKDHEPEKH